MRLDKQMLNKNENIDSKITVAAKTCEDEFENIWYLINNIDFFEQNNYTPILPQHSIIHSLIYKHKSSGLSSEDRVNFKNIFESDIYNKTLYENGVINANKIINLIKQIFPLLKPYVYKWNFDLFSEYIISLSLYGTSGAYYSTENEGVIILRTNEYGIFKRGLDPSATVVHEIIHIGIEHPIIKNFNLEHNIKERIVDKFLAHHFSDMFPEYELKERGDTRIDEFISTQKHWDNLPRMIEAFKYKYAL